MWRKKKDEQSSTISHNSGVINGSGIMGNVQNQPGAVGSVQNQQSTPADAQTLEALGQMLGQLRQTLAQEREQIGDYDQCTNLLDFADQQKLDEPEGRLMATGILTRLQALCGGAPVVLSLIASTLELIVALNKV